MWDLETGEELRTFIAHRRWKGRSCTRRAGLAADRTPAGATCGSEASGPSRGEGVSHLRARHPPSPWLRACPRAKRAGMGRVPSRQTAGVLACDFFTVETVALTRMYVLSFIELERRLVWLGGVSPHPTGEWVTQQARNPDHGAR